MELRQPTVIQGSSPPTGAPKPTEANDVVRNIRPIPIQSGNDMQPVIESLSPQLLMPIGSGIRLSKLSKRFLNKDLERLFQVISWADSYLIQVSTLMVLVAFRLFYLVRLFAQGSTLVGAIIVSLLQLVNITFLFVVALCLRPKRKSMRHGSSENLSTLIRATTQPAAPQPGGGSQAPSAMDGTPWQQLQFACTDLFPCCHRDSLFNAYVPTGLYSIHFCLTLVFEASISTAIDWKYCHTDAARAQAVCRAFAAGLFPMYPTAICILTVFAIAVLSSNFLLCACCVPAIFIPLFFQSGFLVVPAEGNSDGQEFQAYGIVRACILWLSAMGLSTALCYTIQSVQRESLKLMLNLQEQRLKEREQFQREQLALTQLNATRERYIATSTAQGVQALTLGYVGNQAANVVHQLQYACDNLSCNQMLPEDAKLDIADLDDALVRLKRILADVMSHQNLLSGNVELEPQLWNIRERLRAFTLMMQAIHNCLPTIVVEDDVPQEIYCDWLRIEQVLANSFTNAMEASSYMISPELVVKLIATPSAQESEPYSNDFIVTLPTWLHECEAYTQHLKQDPLAPPPHLSRTGVTSEQSHSGSQRWEWCLHLEVANHGVGLRNQKPLALFLPFEPGIGLEASASRYHNTGLGLPIARLLALKMKARIGLVDEPSSEAAAFTRFFMEIPISSILPPIAKAGSGPATESKLVVETTPLDRRLQYLRHRTASVTSSHSSPRSSTSPSNFRLLIVDDVEANRKVNARIAEKLGYITDQASDGDEVMALVKAATDAKQPYKGILLDIVMQRQHGDDTCKQLRNAGFKTIIIAATGNATPADRQRYKDAGFDAILEKPFTLAHVRRCFQSVGLPVPSSRTPMSLTRDEHERVTMQLGDLVQPSP
jgi:CheY-like chemotaxis protein